MKLRPATLHLPAQFHRPLRFGRHWRNHELALRVIQVALLIVFAAVASRLIANGVAMAAKALAGII